MGKFIDLTGQKFGMLTVIKRAETCIQPNGKRVTMWECECDCGIYKIVQAGALKSGAVQSCGSLKRHGKDKADNLIGQKFGKLTVIDRANNTKSGSARWLCQCDCGKQKTVDGYLLKSGKTTNCGCEYFHDLTGERFGRLTVVERVENYVSPNGKWKQTRWKCLCDCGNYKIIHATSLTRGLTRSCGCYNDEEMQKRKIKHNMTRSRLYMIWCNMKDRCYNKNADSYKDYGGRGIKICPEWQEFIPFMEWEYKNGFDENLEATDCSIDRINTNGNYCPENCKWSNIYEQANNKRSNHILEYRSEKKTMAQWARELEIPYSTLSQRIRRGWSTQRALETPIGDDKWHKKKK